jgi:hypothetical protein
MAGGEGEPARPRLPRDARLDRRLELALAESRRDDPLRLTARMAGTQGCARICQPARPDSRGRAGHDVREPGLRKARFRGPDVLFPLA